MNKKNKNYKINQSIKVKSHKRHFIIGALLFVTVLTFGYIIFQINNTDKVVNNDAKTTSNVPSAQENFTNGDDRPVLESESEKGQASVSDSQGNIQTTPNQSEWTTSKTGEITVYSPSTNQIVQNGTILSGESSLPVVSFRIIDNVSGMINEGQLTVVNGKFSATLSFNTSATEGRIDIFSLDNTDKEYSNVEIIIRFE